MFNDYTIKKSKGRNIRISINRDGQVALHIPKFVPQFVAKRFLRSKSLWIEKVLEKIKKTTPDLTSNRRGNSRHEYLNKKSDARKLVLEKLEFWKKFYQENFGIVFVWKKVSIKNSKTRWGSCSSRKNLNFNFRIIFLEPEPQDYLIIHELCHLLEMNHSQNFWKHVSLASPNYKKVRKKLKEFRL